MNKKTAIIAQLIKEAGEIDSEKKLAKMLCYIEKERNIKTGFKFNKNYAHSHYTFEIKEETERLKEKGLIKFRVEKGAEYWNSSLKKHIFIATDKLKNQKLPLTDKEKRAVHSIYREYSNYSPKEIERYDHAVYRDKKTRTNVEFREYSLKRTKRLIRKHKGNEEAAFKEWLSS